MRSAIVVEVVAVVVAVVGGDGVDAATAIVGHQMFRVDHTLKKPFFVIFVKSPSDVKTFFLLELHQISKDFFAVFIGSLSVRWQKHYLLFSLNSIG